MGLTKLSAGQTLPSTNNLLSGQSAGERCCIVVYLLLVTQEIPTRVTRGSDRF